MRRLTEVRVFANGNTCLKVNVGTWTDTNGNCVLDCDQLTTYASHYGEQYSRYNGLLVNLAARTKNGVTFQGGVNVERR